MNGRVNRSFVPRSRATWPSRSIGCCEWVLQVIHHLICIFGGSRKKSSAVRVYLYDPTRKLSVDRLSWQHILWSLLINHFFPPRRIAKFRREFHAELNTRKESNWTTLNRMQFSLCPDKKKMRWQSPLATMQVNGRFVAASTHTHATAINNSKAAERRRERLRSGELFNRRGEGGGGDLNI